jgi:hypothetical protein
MDRIARECEEVHAFGGTAERTGVVLELRSIKTGQRTCTSLRDLVRKYKLYGDGLFYLAIGNWPRGEREVSLDNVKWIGVTRASSIQKATKPRRGRRV